MRAAMLTRSRADRAVDLFDHIAQLDPDAELHAPVASSSMLCPSTDCWISIAVQAAIEIQQSVEGHNIELEADRRMQFRIGVNLGDVIEEADGTIYGDGVNIAARMEALAEGGGVCISSTVYDAVEGKLSYGFDFLGEQQVKNIAKPVRVYRVRAEPKPPSARPRSKRRMQWQIAVPALALILLLGVAGAWLYRDLWMPAPEGAAEHTVLGAPDGPAIAVLPFVNLSGDPQQEYFSDGLTEDLMTALSRASSDLRVLARNTTFQYKGKAVDVPKLGRELGVRYVLEGSVRRADDGLRITAQLIDTQTGAHIWADRFDREDGRHLPRPGRDRQSDRRQDRRRIRCY